MIQIYIERTTLYGQKYLDGRPSHLYNLAGHSVLIPCPSPSHGYNSLYSSRKSFHQILCVNVTMCGWSVKRALVKSGTDVGQEDMAHWCFHLFRHSVEWRSGHSRSSNPNPANQVFMELALCTLAQSCLNNKKGLPQTVFSKLEVHNCLKCLCIL